MIGPSLTPNSNSTIAFQVLSSNPAAKCRTIKDAVAITDEVFRLGVGHTHGSSQEGTNHPAIRFVGKHADAHDATAQTNRIIDVL